MVYVEKGGEIIPKITGVELSERPAGSRPFEFISRCPECGTELVKYEGEARHYCPNQSHWPAANRRTDRPFHFAQGDGYRRTW